MTGVLLEKRDAKNMLTQRKGHVKTQQEQSHLQVKDRGLRRKQTYWHLENEKINLSFNPSGLYYFVMSALVNCYTLPYLNMSECYCEKLLIPQCRLYTLPPISPGNCHCIFLIHRLLCHFNFYWSINSLRTCPSRNPHFLDPSNHAEWTNREIYDSSKSGQQDQKKSFLR